MITDIFIKSYRGDFCWLQYCLRSINKFCHGYRNVIIVVPEEDRDLIKGMNLTKELVFYVKEAKGDSYLFQQVVKCNADRYTNADMVLFTDSDTIFIKDNSPETFLFEGKPFMLVTPYSELGNAVPWKPITEKALGFECPYETMRRLPFIYKPKLLKEFRAYLEGLHGIPIEKYIMNQKNREFSEFNAIGSWTHRLAPEEFFFWDTSTANAIPETVVKQEWSWGGLKPEIKRGLEQILS